MIQTASSGVVSYELWVRRVSALEDSSYQQARAAFVTYCAYITTEWNHGRWIRFESVYCVGTRHEWYIRSTALLLLDEHYIQTASSGVVSYALLVLVLVSSDYVGF